MAFITTVLSGLNFVPNYEVCDDITDRLHYKHTSALLVALAILVSFKQFGGKPLECMVPQLFSGPWEQYAENFCFAQDTYFLPMSANLRNVSSEVKEEKRVNYYQWVPFVLLFAAGAFQLPHLLWKAAGQRSGIRVHNITSEANSKKNLEESSREETVTTLAKHLEKAFRFQRRRHKNPKRCPVGLSHTSCYVTGAFLLSKVLSFLLVWLQFSFMASLLSREQKGFYSWDVVSMILSGASWETTGLFPRVTLCDYNVRRMGNVQRYTMQCVLVINMLNEKIFVFFWFWYQFLMLATGLSLVYWCVVIFVPSFPRSFVARHLLFDQKLFDLKDERQNIRRFVSQYLRTDGVFTLRMIEMQTGVIFGTELLLRLYKKFYECSEMDEPKKKPRARFDKKRMRFCLDKNDSESEAEAYGRRGPKPLTSYDHDDYADEEEDEDQEAKAVLRKRVAYNV